MIVFKFNIFDRIWLEVIMVLCIFGMEDGKNFNIYVYLNVVYII